MMMKNVAYDRPKIVLEDSSDRFFAGIEIEYVGMQVKMMMMVQEMIFLRKQLRLMRNPMRLTRMLHLFLVIKNATVSVTAIPRMKR